MSQTYTYPLPQIVESLIDPILYSKFILYYNSTFNTNNDLGFINEYSEMLLNLYNDFLVTYKDLLNTHDLDCIQHYLESEYCITYTKEHLRLELNYV